MKTTATVDEVLMHQIEGTFIGLIYHNFTNIVMTLILCALVIMITRRRYHKRL